MTNGEAIRKMNDNELANFLVSFDMDLVSADYCRDHCPKKNECTDHCIDVNVNNDINWWIGAEAKGA